MKKIFILLSVSFIFSACKKQHTDSCVPATPTAESASMAAFCSANSINYITDSNGIFYQVVDPGSGSRATMDSVITVTYSTSLLNGQLIDTSHFITPITLPLNQFVEGWRIAIPYIQEGGHIKMVTPSSLAYGCTGIQNLVPPNSPLYYDVLLISVSN